MQSNTKEFANEIKNTKLQEGKCITSFDVFTLFISIPAASANLIIKNRLEQDKELLKRTIISANNFIELLGFCLNNTYFLFQGQFFEQTKGTVMVSPLSPIVANLYMETFEHMDITTPVNPHRIWKRYVDNTFVNQQQTHREVFLKHINSVDPSNSL